MIATDNASNNFAMMQKLQELWPPQGIQFKAKEQHNRCMAHIINLAVQAALKELQWTPSDVDTQGNPVFDRNMEHQESQRREDTTSVALQVP